MLILLTCSSMIMAEDEETVNITDGLDFDNLAQKSTTLTEDIPSSFTWSIPESLTISGTNETITVKVIQAHLFKTKNLKISIENLGDDNKVQLMSSNRIGGSKVVFKKGEIALTKDNPNIMTVQSGTFESDGDIQSVDITLTVERNAFQYANTYTGQVTFKASIS